MFLDRDQMKTLFWMGVASLLIISVAAVMAHAAEAEAPASCPPKIYICRQVKAAFEKYGEAQVVARARSCGWTEAEIARAQRCTGH